MSKTADPTMRIGGVFDMSGEVDFELRYVRGHIEVFQGGEFVLSADTVSEAIHELRAKREE